MNHHTQIGLVVPMRRVRDVVEGRHTVVALLVLLGLGWVGHDDQVNHELLGEALERLDGAAHVFGEALTLALGVIHFVPRVDHHDLAPVLDHCGLHAIEHPIEAHIVVFARHHEREVLVDPLIGHLQFLGVAILHGPAALPCPQVALVITLGRLLERREGHVQAVVLDQAAAHIVHQRGLAVRRDARPHRHVAQPSLVVIAEHRHPNVVDRGLHHGRQLAHAIDAIDLHP